MIDSSAALTTLHSVFGFSAFRPNQQAIIDSILQGEHNFVLMPTGGGKSICYQIPAIIRPGTGIVVSPLISLMRDQVDALLAHGVSAAYYNSSLSSEQARSVLAKLHDGALDLLYIAPERLLSESFLQRLHTITISVIAIDEAHCISQWGHDFRPEYVGLGQLRTEFPNCPIVALTATADKQSRQDIVTQLTIQNAKVHIASFDRPNIRYTVVEKYKPLQQLKQFLRKYENESGIIYCLSRKKVEELATSLQQAGFTVRPYHAGLPSKLKDDNQVAFLRDEVKIIVATVAFGMGIDKSNVRFVVHYQMPKNIEGYYQETGRAGRDGLAAEALLLYSPQDSIQIRKLLENSANPQQLRIETHKLQAMTAFAEAQTCRRQVLLHYFSESTTEHCSNCDVCLNPPQKFTATEEAQMALSAIYRCRQSYGIMHVINVLRGVDNGKIRSLQHHKLSTYGIGKEKSEGDWLSIIRQLIHLGFVEQDIAHYSVLVLTSLARPLLRGEQTLMLAKPRQTISNSSGSKSSPGLSKNIGSYDSALFNVLRKLRFDIAMQNDVPAFVVFSDASLAEMAAVMPENAREFLSINGVGQKKLLNYGDVFLQAIKEYKQAAHCSMSPC